MTLIEVCLATAVAAFSVMVVLGVLSGALQGGRHTSDATNIGLIQQRLLADLHGQPFTSIQLSDCGTITLNLSSINSNVGPVNYTQTGLPGTPAYYLVYISSRPTNIADLARVSVSVVWPANVAYPKTNTIYSWLTRRQ